MKKIICNKSMDLNSRNVCNMIKKNEIEVLYVCNLVVGSGFSNTLV